jgi:hypothetical protein
LTTKQFVEKDKNVISFLLKNEKWETLDSYLTSVLESNDRKRYKKVYKLLKEYRESKMFKPFLDILEHRIVEMKRYG